MYLKSEETRKMVLGTCLYYGLKFWETETGLLIQNLSEEFFLIRLSKGTNATVRRLLHENHGRGCAKSTFDPENFTRDDISNSFHSQEVFDIDGNPEKDLKRVLKYIFAHGTKRSQLNKIRNATLTAILA